jgi:hypothetical protein
VPTSLTEPLTFVAEIQTKDEVFDIFRNGQELLFGEHDGWLEVLDIPSATISHTWQIKEIFHIQAIEAIDKTQFLLASRSGLFKSTKEKIIEHYYQGKDVSSLCLITDAIYLVALYTESLIVWNEQTASELFRVFNGDVILSKRVLSNNSFII